MRKINNKLLSITKETGKEFARHNPLLIDAALSFYILLSLGLILVIIVFSR